MEDKQWDLPGKGKVGLKALDRENQGVWRVWAGLEVGVPGKEGLEG